MRPVAILQVGVLAPPGIGPGPLRKWLAPNAGQDPGETLQIGGWEPCSAELTCLPEPWLPVPTGCEVPDWNRKTPRRHLPDRKALKLMTRPVQLGLAAALQAWPESETDPPEASRGMWVGADVAVDEDWTFREPFRAAVQDGQFSMRAFAEQGQEILNPLWLVKGLSNNVLAFASKERKIRGANDNFEAGEAGPLQALASAWNCVAAGRVERALAGGAGSRLTVEAQIALGRHGVPDWTIGEAAAFVQLGPGESGRWGVLAQASGRVPAGDARGFEAPDEAPELLADLLRVAEKRAGQMVFDVLPGPALSRAIERTQFPKRRLCIGGGAKFLQRAPELWDALGDAGAGSGALMLALLAVDYEAPVFTTALAAASPGGEVEVVIVGPLP
jgi:hypothetical protein